MPQNKDLKRLVRARMRKTGEAYSAARAHIIRHPATRSETTTETDAVPVARRARASRPTLVDYSLLAGVSDASVKEKTGCAWERWVYALDRRGAAEMSHRDIASLVRTKYKLDSWWAQTVTVGYERIKGLRMKRQRRDGTYGASKSRTFAVPVKTLFDAWADARVRRRWLDSTSVTVRTTTAPKSMRLGWADGGIIAVGFAAKGKGKSTVALEHTKLPDRETADRLKQFWSERLDALGTLMNG